MKTNTLGDTIEEVQNIQLGWRLFVFLFRWDFSHAVLSLFLPNMMLFFVDPQTVLFPMNVILSTLYSLLFQIEFYMHYACTYRTISNGRILIFPIHLITYCYLCGLYGYVWMLIFQVCYIYVFLNHLAIFVFHDD